MMSYGKKKSYREYVSMKENTKAETYIPKYEDRSYNWAHVKMDPVKAEVKT